MTNEKLKALELKHKSKLNKIKENECYVLGQNPTIYKKENQKDPDWRLPIPLAKSAVEDMTGYAASFGSINIEYKKQADETAEETAKREEYIDINKQIYSHNNADLETTELYNQALTQGVSYELFWISDKLSLSDGVLTPEFAMVDNKSIELIYSDDIKPRLLSAARFWIGEDGTEHADIYYPLRSESYVKVETKGKKESEWIRNEDGDTFYPYTSVPIAVYKINRDSMPLFEAEKPTIDAHDNLISKSLNEIDRFNALIALFPGKVNQSFINKMMDSKIIDDLDQYDKMPEYLEKTLSNIDGFYNALADRLERLYHKTIKVPDFSDQSFAGNQSGIAIQYKLMGLEYKASQIEAYFNSGLMQRQELIDEVLNAGTKTYEAYQPYVDSKRNIPIDEASKALIVKDLYGIVSRETLLKFIPNNIVNDVAIELDRIDAENGLITDLDKVVI